MTFITSDPQNAVRLNLVRDRTRALKQGYPWVYRDWLKELPPAPVGSRAMVLGVYGQPADHPFPLVCRELQ